MSLGFTLYAPLELYMKSKQTLLHSPEFVILGKLFSNTTAMLSRLLTNPRRKLYFKWTQTAVLTKKVTEVGRDRK